MQFFDRFKTVELSCLTTVHGLPDLFPPVRATKVTPDWWRRAKYVRAERGSGCDLFSLAMQQGTIKNCSAVQQIFERAVALRLWFDYFVQVDSSGNVRGLSPNRNAGGEHHPTTQYPGMMLDGWVHWKIRSPWLIQSNRRAKFLMLSPFYHIEHHDWQTMPGIMDFYDQHHSHINIVFRAPVGVESVEYEFHAGDVVAYLVPLFEEKVRVTAKLIDESEWDRIDFGKRIWFRRPIGRPRKSEDKS